jgi:hypothetical protein
MKSTDITFNYQIVKLGFDAVLCHNNNRYSCYSLRHCYNVASMGN